MPPYIFESMDLDFWAHRHIGIGGKLTPTVSYSATFYLPYALVNVRQDIDELDDKINLSLEHPEGLICFFLKD